LSGERAGGLQARFLALGRSGGTTLRERERFARDLELELDGARVGVESALACLLGCDLAFARVERRSRVGSAGFGAPDREWRLCDELLAILLFSHGYSPEGGVFLSKWCCTL
jgi:hypothetical protein